MIFSPLFSFWKREKESDDCFGRTFYSRWMVEEYLWGLYRSVIDATLHGTAVVVVYSTIKGGKKKWELAHHHLLFWSWRGWPICHPLGADYTHILLYTLRCSLDLFFRSLSQDLFDRTVSVLHRYDDRNVKHWKLFIPIHPHLFENEGGKIMRQEKIWTHFFFFLWTCRMDFSCPITSAITSCLLCPFHWNITCLSLSLIR
jgi:hypothetical protein